MKNFYYPKDASYSTKTAKEVLNLATNESGCKVYDGKSRIYINSGGATLEFVQSYKDYSSDNQNSIMTYVSYGDLDVLLTGDVNKGSECDGKEYNVDIVQVPHHGSSSSSSYRFIEKYDPEVIDGDKGCNKNVTPF